MHHTEHQPAVRFSTLILSQRLVTRFPAALGSSGHRLITFPLMNASNTTCHNTATAVPTSRPNSYDCSHPVYKELNQLTAPGLQVVMSGTQPLRLYHVCPQYRGDLAKDLNATLSDIRDLNEHILYNPSMLEVLWEDITEAVVLSCTYPGDDAYSLQCELLLTLYEFFHQYLLRFDEDVQRIINRCLPSFTPQTLEIVASSHSWAGAPLQ
ncbi:hypothetical protein NMY22_g5211 [Coprinellus aureogranulatus]|nr:hypothetical protein NMY22_g5211 [Coprinellus aureogranulatus]